MFKGIKRISALVLACLTLVGVMGFGQSESGLALTASAYELPDSGLYQAYEAPKRDWAPLTGCYKYMASNEDGHYRDVVVGNWYARSGKLKDSIRFAVANKESWKNTHYIIYDLNREYTELTGLVSYCDKSEAFAEATVKIYLDNELAFTSDTISERSSDDDFTLDVEDVKYVRIVCSTTKTATAYCAVAASVR